MKMSIVLLSALLLSSVVQAQVPPAKDTVAQVESRLKERRDTLQRLVQILENGYRMGTVDFTRVASVAGKLADAELDLAKNKDERIAACRKQFEWCRGAEKVCQARFESGTVTESDVLEAKAERLKAEIRLLKETAK